MPTFTASARPILWRALLAALLVVAVVRQVTAAEPAPPRRAPARPFRLATLDLARLVKQHPLHQQLTELVEEQEAFQRKQSERQRRRAQEALLRLEQTEPGTREHKRIQAEIAQLELDSQLSAAPTTQQLDGAEVFGRIFREIHDITERYRRQHGISLVLQKSAGEADEEELPDVVEVMNRFVLYDAGHDITDDILRELKASHADHQP